MPSQQPPKARARGRVTANHAAHAAEQRPAAAASPPSARPGRGTAAAIAAAMGDVAAAPKVAPTDEIGAFGTKIFAGLLNDEYNPALQGSKKFLVYDQMRRGDGQVRALLAVLKLPIRSAPWSVEPHDPDDEDAVAQAEFAEDAILKHMDQTWSDALRDALLCLDFGFMVQEKVWDVRDLADWGRALVPKYLAFRHPATVYRWNTDPQTGRLVSVTQLPPPLYDYRVMPADKLLLYSPEQEGANFEGISTLRAAYQHWYIKKTLYVLQSIALARSGMGIPYVELADGASAQEKADALQLVTTMTTSEQAGLTVPKGMVPGVITFPQIANFQEAIDHHNRMIAISALAQFLDLGSGGGGSWALSQDQSQLLLNSLNTIADHVSSRIDQGLIRPLIRANFAASRIKGYPTLTHGDIGMRDIAKLSTAISALVTAGVLRADDPLEDRVRTWMQLPEADPDSARQAPGQAPAAGPPGLDDAGQPGNPAALVVGADGAISAAGQAPPPGGTPAPAGPPANVVAPDSPVAAGETARLLHLADLNDALADACDRLAGGDYAAA